MRVPIPSSGLVIGRSASCDMVLTDPRVSRLHAFVHRAPAGLTIVPLGKQPVAIGEPGGATEKTHATRLADGDELVIGSARFHVEDSSPRRIAVLFLEIHGLRVPLRATPFDVGGGSSEQLVVAGWPEHALRFYQLASDRVLVERRAAVEIEGAHAWEASDLLAVRPGMAFRFAGVTVTLVDAEPTAITGHRASAATSAMLEFLPNGGLLTIDAGGLTRVFLPNRRCDLVAALLSPTDREAGELVPDEALCRRIWGPAGATRAQLNMLIHRTRVTLARAGLDGFALIVRPPGGGSTGFALQPGAPAEVRFASSVMPP